MDRLKVHFVTAVWGESYARLFLNLLLRTLVAERNLPLARGRADLRYRIYTDKNTASMLQESPNWPSLNKSIDVDIILQHDIQYRDPIESHHHIWMKATEHARATKAAVVFVAPDTMWANGSIAHLVELFEKNHAAVFFPGFRVGNDTFYDAMMQEFGDDSGAPIALSPTELMDRAMRHMHPLKTVFLRHSTMYPTHMENLLWPVNEEGYVLRQYITHSLHAFNPSAIHVNNYSVPMRPSEMDKVHWVQGSDEVLFVSLGPMARDQHWYDSGRKVDANHIAMKSLELDSSIVPPLIQRKFKFHHGIRDASAWRNAERASDLFTHRVRVAREVIQIWRNLDREGCTLAADLLLITLYGRSLSHAINFAGPVTIFCPTNEKLAAVDDNQWNHLRQEGTPHQLRQTILAHVVPGRFAESNLREIANGTLLPRGKIRVKTTGADVLVNGVRIVRSNISCGDHIIHHIEAPLPAIASPSGNG